MPTTFLEYECPFVSITEKSNVQSNTWGGKQIVGEKRSTCTRRKGGYQPSCGGITSRQLLADRIVRYTVRSDSVGYASQDCALLRPHTRHQERSEAFENSGIVAA